MNKSIANKKNPNWEVSGGFDPLTASLNRLTRAIDRKRSRRWQLRCWSSFIRLRDGFRCVYCESQEGIAAHHIFRKVVLPEAELQTGNGITLCSTCHKIIHTISNTRPLDGEALNARGGDDLDYIQSLYHALTRDSEARNLLAEEFYYLSDSVLGVFKRYQGLKADVELSGSPIKQAHAIWQNGPVGYYTVLAEYFGEALLTSQWHH